MKQYAISDTATIHPTVIIIYLLVVFSVPIEKRCSNGILTPINVPLLLLSVLENYLNET